MPAPEISGPASVCVDEQADYSTPDNPGSTYDWNVTGGSIITGAGTHQITILWETAGTGNVEVTEDNGDCQGTTELEVIVEDCTGLDEQGAGYGVVVYPNPVKDHLNLILLEQIGRNGTLTIYNHLGRTILENTITTSTRDREIRLDISTLSKGIFILRIADDQGLNLTRKFIRE